MVFCASTTLRVCCCHFLPPVAELPSSPLGRSISPIVVQNSELMYTEAWQLHTACVHLSFTKSDKYEDTLRPKDFIDDFPLHLWLFLPRQRREGEADPSHTAPSVLNAGTPTRISSSRGPPLPQAMAPPDNGHPTISFIAYVSDAIHAELERLQFLFLLRLKESFVDLKTSAMKFLSLTSPGQPAAEGTEEEKVQEVTSPTTPRLFPGNSRHDTLVAGDECEVGDGGERGEGEGPVLSGINHSSVRTEAGVEGVTSEPDQKTSSASIAGCVIVHSLQADIILPSMFSEKTSKGVASDKNTPAPLSPSSPLHPSLPSMLSDNSPVVQSPSHTPTRLTSPPRRDSAPFPSPSPLSHIHVAPSQADNPHTLTVPSSGSQLSLLSQTSQTSSTSQPSLLLQSQVSTGLRQGTGLTGSQTSLPILFEAGQSSDGDRGSDVVSLHGDHPSPADMPHRHSQV